MLRFVDSFGHYATADILKKWTSSTSVSGAVTSIINPGTGRFGGPSLRNNSGWIRLLKTLDAQQTWILGVAYKWPDATAGRPILGIYDAGTIQCHLRVNTDGTLSVVRGSGGGGVVLGTTSFAISIGTYRYFELKVKIHSSLGTVDVRVNGDSKLSLTGVNTQNTANASANQVGLASETNNSVNVAADWCDFYACDTQGSINNDFLGDVRVQALLPNGAGNSTVWTPSAGSNYQCVDEATPNDDTDYVQSSTVGDIDLYNYPSVTPVSGVVYGVQTCICARKDDAGTRTIKAKIRSGGSDFSGTNVDITTSYLFYSEVHEQDPNGPTAWTISSVNAAEFGVEEVA